MKLYEIVMEATKHDLDGTDADTILAIAKAEKSVKPRMVGWKKIILIAAAVCLFTGTVSAAAYISGFGKAFEHQVDTGHVEILSAESDNEDVTWMFTETWFDEYNLHIGGTVVTPEPLDTAGDHRVMCYYRVPGETEYRVMTGYIFASGENEAAFIISGGTVADGEDNFTRTGFEGNEITLELKLCLLHDYSLIQKTEGQQYFIEDHVTYPGEWSFKVSLESNDDSAVHLSGNYESKAPDSSDAVVTSVTLSSFSLEISGENLVYNYHMEDGTEESSLGVWLKMKDGTMLGKSSGVFAHTENRIEYSKASPEYMIICFDEPVDADEVQSVVLFADWMNCPEGAEAYLTEHGWVFYPSDDEEGRLDAWIEVMEIPVS